MFIEMACKTKGNIVNKTQTHMHIWSTYIDGHFKIKNFLKNL